MIKREIQMTDQTVEMNKWISVKDRLPEVEKRVLVFRSNYEGDDYNKIHVGFLQHKDGFYGSQWGLLDDDLFPHTLVTHWMPLPNPPEDK